MTYPSDKRQKLRMSFVAIMEGSGLPADPDSMVIDEFMEIVDNEVHKAEDRVIRIASNSSSRSLIINRNSVCGICGLISEDLGDMITTKVRDGGR